MARHRTRWRCAAGVWHPDLTLRSWVQRAEAQADPTRNAALADRERLKQLERENAELKRAHEILRKASAFFAQAELDRRGKY